MVADPAAGLVARWPSLRAAWRALTGSTAEGTLTRPEIASAARAIGELSHRLTQERERVDERYLEDPALLGAYLLFYWPVSYAQARSVFAEHGALGDVLDLGAGPLPMSWAAIDAGATSVLALERVARARTLGESLGGGALSTRAWTAADPLPDARYDTIVLGHVMNELHTDARDPIMKRADLVAALLRRLRPNGRVVIIEPALRETSRAVSLLRDRVLAAGASVYAPCLARFDCPALVRPTDWCHAERTWSPPAELDVLADAARVHRDRLKLAYLVLGNEAAASFTPDLFRIVSEPLDEKGKRSRVGCGPRGRHRLVLRERDLDAHNRVFEALQRGDIVRLGDVEEKGDGLRIASDAPVDRVSAAGAPPPAGRT